MQNNSEPQNLLTVNEAAERLRLSPRSVARMIADGSLASIKILRQRLIPASSIEQLLQTATTE
jgi:excisionase family DNA binding protein